MKIYLAARYSRRVELLNVATRLELYGHQVTSRWLDGSHDDMPEEAAALCDLADIEGADCLVSFTEAPGVILGRARGGRHVEFGFAYALTRRVIVLGPRENVFHHLPRVEVVGDVRQLFQLLGPGRGVLALEVDRVSMVERPEAGR